MKKLLVNAKELRELIGITPETALMLDNFPKPVKIGLDKRYWKLKDIKKWVKHLPQKVNKWN